MRRAPSAFLVTCAGTVKQKGGRHHRFYLRNWEKASSGKQHFPDREKASLVSRPDGKACRSPPRDPGVLLQAREALLIIKLLPLSSAPHFSALLAGDWEAGGRRGDLLTCCSCQPHSGKLPVLFHTLRTSLPMPCRGGSTARHQPCLQSPLLSLCYGSTQPSKLPGSQPRKPAPSWQVLATPASASFP